MGYILSPVAVDLRQTSELIGSKSKQLISDLVEMFGNHFDQFDEMAADYAEAEPTPELGRSTGKARAAEGA
jgi:hypothetical protein